MGFVLRDAESTDNPPLATVYGKQITQGKLVYYSDNKSISILGDGEMDGIDQLLYNGEVLSGDTWVFHPGTITTQIVPIDVTAISGDTLTLASNPYNTTTESEVAIVAGVDPDPSPYPAGVRQHQKLYVVDSSGNTIKVATAPGGTPVTWTSSSYLLTNLKVYRANAGYFDPIQGRPTFFPDIDYTFSGIAYVEVALPSEMASVEDEPSKFKIFVRGRRIQNYTSTGLLADADGVAYPDQNNLPAQTKFYTANNALVAVDIILNYMRIPKSRIDWATFVRFRDYCNQVIAWNSGSKDLFTFPSWTNASPSYNGLDDAIEVGIGSVKKVTTTVDTWDSGAASYQTIADDFTNFKIQCVYRGGHLAMGIVRTSGIPNVWSDIKYGFHPSILTGKLYFIENNDINFSLPSIRDAVYGDRLKIEGTPTSVTYYVNDEAVYTTSASFGTGAPLRAVLAFNSPEAKVSDFKMSPLVGVDRAINRFDAHLVFPSEVACVTALEQVMGRAPDCHWQDVDGKIKFIVGSNYVDVTTGGVPAPGDRTLTRIFSYDPSQSQVKSNIVADSFGMYKKPADEKQNFLRIEFRDIEDEFYTKKYTFKDRPELRDYVDHLVDFGVVQIGVASQSLSDRMADSILGWNSDLDLFLTMKGTAETFDVAKGDIVKFAHDVPGWTLETAPTFVVIDETFEPETADERSFTLQIYDPSYYSDTAHGAVTPSLPPVQSALTPPPPVDNLNLMEETRKLPDGTEYSTIVGTVTFGASQFNQRVRVYWKRPSDVSFNPTSVVLEQPNTSITQMSFELNFAALGEHEVKVVTETLSGVVSTSDVTETIDVEGVLQVNYVEWEGLVNTQLIGTSLVKTVGTTAWDAGARSTRELHHGYGYVQWNVTATGKIAIGLTGYNNTTLAQNNTAMRYGLILETGQQPIPIVSGVNQSAVGAVVAVGQGYKIEVDPDNNIVNFYQVINEVATVMYTTPSQNKYPLFVDASIFNLNDMIVQPQFYGRLENTTGIKLHWKNIQGLTFNTEVISKIAATGWTPPSAASAFSIEYLIRDGALEFEATEYDKYRMVGLSATDANEADPTLAANDGVKYSIYLKGSTFNPPTANGFTVREWISGAGSEVYAGTFVTGDIFRIQRVDNTITYWQNNNLIYTSPVASATGEKLHADLGFYDNGGTVKNVRFKKVGVFTQITHPYPIYEATNLKINESRPQDDGSVFIQASGTFPADNEAPITKANIKVFDKFGNIIKTFPPFTYAGDGVIGQGYHDRKYADPFSEAIYEISVVNDVSVSQQSMFIQGNGAFPPVFAATLVKPPLKNINQAVKDLSAVPVDHTKINLSWNYTANAQVQYRTVDKDRVSSTGGWSTAITGLTSPYAVSGLVPDTAYEFRAAPTGTTDNYSNIASAKTQAAPLPADAAPPALNLVATLNPGTPTTSVDLSWTRNSTTNTGVKIYQNGSLIYTGTTATEVMKTITGLTAATTYTFSVKNIYSGGDSQFSNDAVITTSAGVSTNSPSGLDANAVSTNRIDLSWINNTSSGNVLIERSLSEDSGFVQIASKSASFPATYSNIGLTPSTAYYYRVKNDGVVGYSNVTLAVTYDLLGNGGDGCITPHTLVYVVNDAGVLQKKAKDVHIGDLVLTVTKGGTLAITTVFDVVKGKTDKLNVFTTTSGKSLECSFSHPLITDLDLTVVKSINVSTGDYLLVYDEMLDKVHTEMVESKDTLEGDFDILIFELADKEHTFISGGIVSHNRDNKY